VSLPLYGFQSVSGLWDRRNLDQESSGDAKMCFNPSPVCGTGEILVVVNCRQQQRVSIRLRSVGPEKFDTAGDVLDDWEFQSVSGLWDRRNWNRPAHVKPRRACFNPSPVCGTGEIPRGRP